jgi:phosphoribosylformylglycinamidine synthase
VEQTLTPQLDTTQDTVLILVDLGTGRLGGSALAQVYNQIGDSTPDVDPVDLKHFFETIQILKNSRQILAYHDRSDGGMFTTLVEMAFAGRCGLDIDLANVPGNDLDRLFNEELGAVLQVRTSDAEAIVEQFQAAYIIGTPTKDQIIGINDGETEMYRNSRAQLEQWWSDTSYAMQRRRDNSDCADQEYLAITNKADPGLTPVSIAPAITAQYATKPKVAIFREQGVNGQVEMAAAFDRAGFTSIDVHLNDIIDGRVSLDEFVGLVACGGFSYGDVLGAGEGWAKTVLSNPELRAAFKTFFERPDTFTLGVCNGCQMLSALKDLIPGTETWPRFLRNKSEQFEARVSLTKINQSPSIFFKDMAGSYLPIPVAHGEGQASFASAAQMQQAFDQNLVAMQFSDNNHTITESYPANPNGSPQGITSLTTPDGRATILMPHPERAFLSRQLSWAPVDWPEDSPWLHIFQNARAWTERHTR